MFTASEFKGRHVFVAGGSSGINFGIATAFARAGAHVSLISRSEEKVHKAVQQLADTGAQAFGQSADVRDPAAVQSAFEAAYSRFGAIDVLVSGAAGNFLARALDMSPNAFKTVIDIDLLGSFNVLRMSHAWLKKPGASIIQISAGQSFIATPFQAHVCAAKAGVDMLTRTLALEWGADGIRINSIVPGPVPDTEGVRRLAPTAETLETMRQRVPLKSLGRIEDVANAALFLCSDAAPWISGALLPVDGGLALTGPRDFSAAAEASQRQA